MTNAQKQAAAKSIRNFRLPRYHEIPDVGLYLEQTVQYISGFLTPVINVGITSSMVSNYVKKGLIESPVKKRYSREQIAYLFFIAVAKNVLSLDALHDFIRLQKRTYPLEVAYNYYAEEFEDLLFFAFETKDSIKTGSEKESDEKRLLFSCIAAAVEMIYLEKSLAMIFSEENAGAGQAGQSDLV